MIDATLGDILMLVVIMALSIGAGFAWGRATKE